MKKNKLQIGKDLEVEKFIYGITHEIWERKQINSIYDYYNEDVIVNKTKNNFFLPVLSAIAPINGDTIATITAEIAIAFDHIWVPIFSSYAICFVKNELKTKVTTIVEKGWEAKSYKDQEIILFLFIISFNFFKIKLIFKNYI